MTLNDPMTFVVLVLVLLAGVGVGMGLGAYFVHSMWRQRLGAQRIRPARSHVRAL